ncbi:MAG: mechanosensitive ion channel family protein [Cytophagales bacterium]|nr:MAG: mechanosensitive ion channel family protein [Cytophagales bacterium]
MQKFLEQIKNLVFSKFEWWTNLFATHLPNVIVSLLILVIFFKVGGFFKRLSDRAMSKTFDNRLVIRVFVTILYYLFLLFGLFSALKILNLDGTVSSLLAGAGIVGLALSFAFQDLATNFISSVIIIIQKPLKIGDFIETGSFLGYVEKIDLRSVTIRTLEELHIIIPSKDVFQKPLKSYNVSAMRCLHLSVGIPYSADLEKARLVVLEAAKKAEYLADPKFPPMANYLNFAESSITLELRFWLKNSDPIFYLKANSILIVALKKSLDEHDIQIPFPIRTLHLPPQVTFNQNQPKAL